MNVRIVNRDIRGLGKQNENMLHMKKEFVRRGTKLNDVDGELPRTLQGQRESLPGSP